MSKQVHIKDSTYNKLKELADAGYRSISAQIDMLLDDKPAPVVSAAPVVPEPFVPRPPDPITGYPCCLNRVKRCKHWQWDNAQVAWSNTLTGEVIEDI